MGVPPPSNPLRPRWRRPKMCWLWPSVRGATPPRHPRRWGGIRHHAGAGGRVALGRAMLTLAEGQRYGAAGGTTAAGPAQSRAGARSWIARRRAMLPAEVRSTGSLPWAGPTAALRAANGRSHGGDRGAPRRFGAVNRSRSRRRPRPRGWRFGVATRLCVAPAVAFCPPLPRPQRAIACARTA